MGISQYKIYTDLKHRPPYTDIGKSAIGNFQSVKLLGTKPCSHASSEKFQET